MNPLDFFPVPVRVGLEWLAVIMPLVLVSMHTFRRAADALYAYALTTPEGWDDEPMRRFRNAVRWIDGWMLAIGRFIPGPPKPSEYDSTPSYERAESDRARARSSLGDRGQ